MQIVQNVTRLSKLNVCLKFLAEPDSRALHYFNKKSVYTEFPTYIYMSLLYINKFTLAYFAVENCSILHKIKLDLDIAMINLNTKFHFSK